MLKVIIVIIATSWTISSSWEHIGGQISRQDIRDIKPQQYCGPVLSKALALICYAEKEKVAKRAGHNSIYNAIMPPLYKDEEVPYWPWMSAEKARSMGLQARGKRFIVDECCYKACSINELMLYC